MKAAIYLRISQDATGEALGVTRQLEDCVAHAKVLGWEVVEVYTDNDISATSGKVRPGYRKMLTDIEAGQIEAIVTWHADRLYRRAVDLGELVDVCKRNNTQITTVKAGTIDLTTPTGRLVAGLLAQVATYEGEAKSDRWSRSWQQRRDAGLRVRTGSRTFGYTPETEVIEEEAEVVRWMADDLLTGGALLGLARKLEDRGIVGTRGYPWTPQSIKRLLTNPRIAGWSTLKGEIVSEGQWAPILDRETWESVRALLTANTREFVPRKALLNGLIFCGVCQHRLITGSASGKRRYVCPKRPGMPGCGGVSGAAIQIEEVVETLAKELLADPAVRERVDQLRSQPGVEQGELSALELRVQELERQLDEPGTPVATILRAIERTGARQVELMDRIVASPRVPLPQPGTWPEDLRRRRALVDLVVKRVELGPRIPPGSNVFQSERVRVLPR